MTGWTSAQKLILLPRKSKDCRLQKAKRRVHQHFVMKKFVQVCGRQKHPYPSEWESSDNKNLLQRLEHTVWDPVSPSLRDKHILSLEGSPGLWYLGLSSAEVIIRCYTIFNCCITSSQGHFFLWTCLLFSHYVLQITCNRSCPVAALG